MKKVFGKKGFTLMEMLIVVAIIVILVAISIPAFGDSIERSRKATDAANLRSAKAAAVLLVADGSSLSDYYWRVYNFDTGEFEALPDGVDSPTGDSYYGSCENHNDNWIVIRNDGKVVWSAATVAHQEACD